MFSSRQRAVCPVCDSTDYVLRDGEYFCLMCNTQSQELGQETVMDEETVPSGVQGGTDKITLKGRGRGKGRGGKRSLDEGVRWSKVEGMSWILRGWVDQLAKHGIYVQVAATQLWTKYLRELNMGFERPGSREVGVASYNLSYRDRWNMVGGPSSMLRPRVLQQAKKKRITPPSLVSGGEETEDEPDSDEQETLRQRRLRRKKRKQFYQTVSETASTGASSDRMTDSESELEGGSEISNAESMSILMEQFRNGASKPPYLNNIVVTGAQTWVLEVPEKLSMNYLAALLTLAVVGRSNSATTISDMVHMFNNEWLSWAHSYTSLLPHYDDLQPREIYFYSGGTMFCSDHLSTLVFRLASFLKRNPEGPGESPLLISLADSRKTRPEGSLKSQSTFKTVLDRFIRDLSLPSSIGRDIYRVFKPLLLCNVSGTITEFLPWSNTASNRKKELWFRDQFPLVSLRVMGLILLSLKYHCVLDDQFEVYMDHNIMKIKQLDEDCNYFSLLSWIRLSKLRLDHLMSVNTCMRRQYTDISTTGTPHLTSSALAREKRTYDVRAKDKKPVPRMVELTQLFEEFNVDQDSFLDSSLPGRDSSEPGLSLSPLIDSTNCMLGSNEVEGRVKSLVGRLLTFTESDMSIYYPERRKKLKKIVGRGLYKEASEGKLKRSDLKYIKPDRNWVFAEKNRHFPISRKQAMYVLHYKNKLQYRVDVKKGRGERSNCRVPHPGSCPEFLFDVTKQYWFSHLEPGMAFVSKDPMYVDKFLATLPSNYGWVLHYLATYSSLCPVKLHMEVGYLEQIVLTLDPLYFGTPKTFRQKVRQIREMTKKSDKSTRYKDIGFKIPINAKKKVYTCTRCGWECLTEWGLRSHTKRNKTCLAKSL